MSGSSKKDKKKSKKGLLKTPKGTRDYGPDETGVREATIQQIKEIFRQHGAVAIETPGKALTRHSCRHRSAHSVVGKCSSCASF